jgi:hypothetical protein
VLGAVTGRVDRPDPHVAERELPAVVDRLVRVLGARVAMDVDPGPGRLVEAAVPGHVVGVGVRLEHVLDAHAQVARDPQVLADLEGGIDHRGHPRALVADEVRGAPQVVVDELTEDHRPLLSVTEPHLG